MKQLKVFSIKLTMIVESLYVHFFYFGFYQIFAKNVRVPNFLSAGMGFAPIKMYTYIEI